MVDIAYLKDTIERSGLKRQHIADKLGCTRQTFSKKLNKGTFDFKEATILCEIFGFNARERDRIFFAKNVTGNSDKE